MIDIVLGLFKIKKCGLKFLRGHNTGFALIETIAAVAILATVGAAVLSGMMLSTKVEVQTDTSQIAKDLAIAQMEYVKSLPYAATYNPDNSLIPFGGAYSVDITTTSLKADNSLQKVAIKISKSGKTIVQLSDYRTQ